MLIIQRLIGFRFNEADDRQLIDSVSRMVTSEGAVLDSETTGYNMCVFSFAHAYYMLIICALYAQIARISLRNVASDCMLNCVLFEKAASYQARQY